MCNLCELNITGPNAEGLHFLPLQTINEGGFYG